MGHGHNHLLSVTNQFCMRAKPALIRHTVIIIYISPTLVGVRPRPMTWDMSKGLSLNLGSKYLAWIRSWWQCEPDFTSGSLTPSIVLLVLVKCLAYQDISDAVLSISECFDGIMCTYHIHHSTHLPHNQRFHVGHDIDFALLLAALHRGGRLDSRRSDGDLARGGRACHAECP